MILLFNGDKIEYTRDGAICEGVVGSLSGSRIYLQCGYVTYQNKVVRVMENN